MRYSLIIDSIFVFRPIGIIFNNKTASTNMDKHRNRWNETRHKHNERKGRSHTPNLTRGHRSRKVSDNLAVTSVKTLPSKKTPIKFDKIHQGSGGKQRQSLLKRVLGVVTQQSGGEGAKGSRVCGSVIKFQLSTHPPDDIEQKEDARKISKGIITPDNQSKHALNRVRHTDANNNKQPELNSVVTVFHHKASSCYEVSTYDINTKTELNRLYVPAEKVADLTEKKRARMSFMGSSGSHDGDAEKKLSIRFGDLMAFTLDENQQPRVDILRRYGINPRKPSQ